MMAKGSNIRNYMIWNTNIKKSSLIYRKLFQSAIHIVFWVWQYTADRMTKDDLTQQRANLSSHSVYICTLKPDFIPYVVTCLYGSVGLWAVTVMSPCSLVPPIKGAEDIRMLRLWWVSLFVIIFNMRLHKINSYHGTIRINISYLVYNVYKQIMFYISIISSWCGEWRVMESRNSFQHKISNTCSIKSYLKHQFQSVWPYF